MPWLTRLGRSRADSFRALRNGGVLSRRRPGTVLTRGGQADYGGCERHPSHRAEVRGSKAEHPAVFRCQQVATGRGTSRDGVYWCSESDTRHRSVEQSVERVHATVGAREPVATGGLISSNAHDWCG